MRRAGVRPWIATLTAAVFVFFGAGAENILIAFQITFVGSFVFGLAQLLLADHDGPINRRDWLGLARRARGLDVLGRRDRDDRHRRDRDAVAARLADRVAADRAARGRVRHLVAGEPERPRGRALPEPDAGAGREVRRDRHRHDLRPARTGPGLGVVLAVVLVGFVGLARRQRRVSAAPPPVRGAARAARRRRPVPARHRGRALGPAPPIFNNQSASGPTARAEPVRVPRRGDGAPRARDRGRRDEAVAAAHDPDRRAAGGGRSRQHPPAADLCEPVVGRPGPPRNTNPHRAARAAGQAASRDTSGPPVQGASRSAGWSTACRRAASRRPAPSRERRSRPRHSPSACGPLLRENERARPDVHRGTTPALTCSSASR